MKQVFKGNSNMMRLIADKTNLQFDGGDSETRLHLDNININVFAQVMSKREYSKMETLLKKKTIKGPGFIVYAWNDGSGYDYWKEESGGNYIQITANITDLNKLDFEALATATVKLYDFFYTFNNSEEYFAANQGE